MGKLTSKQRLLTALQGGIPDRLPVTTHHVMTSYLDSYLDGASTQEFFDIFGFDAIQWVMHFRSISSKSQVVLGQSEPNWHPITFVTNPEWNVHIEDLSGYEYKTKRYTITTPGGDLNLILQGNEHTIWVQEHLIKDKSDIDLLGKYLPSVYCDIPAVNQDAEAFGERGLIRSHIPGFDLFGQPGCWQDAACLVGIERLIMETYDDPGWVHELLKILQRRKLEYIRSMDGARFDILELGGGDASTTVISPKLFRKFVAPYDLELVSAAHEVGQRIVYHTCGGMMPILEDIADLGVDAMETFTPTAMGADVDLAEAKRRIGNSVCIIGGFDQFHFFLGCSPEDTRTEVRRCFEAAGGDGGYILSPSDHFFEADHALLHAFKEEAHQCTYL
jgi:uroporphyrinogen-III decarboxylase